MSTDIGAIMQLLQRQMALVPPAYSAVSSPPQVLAQHAHVCMHGCQEIKSVVTLGMHIKHEVQ